MGPPDIAEPALWVVTKDGLAAARGEVTDAAVVGGRGSVSKERVRRQEARRSEKESGRTGSWVDV
jgi:hypothetical protein